MSCEYLREFSKKFETALMIYSRAWRKLIHEKTRSRKSRDNIPLTYVLRKVTLGPEILVYQHILEAEEGTTTVTKPTENTGGKKR